jgi:hypothetical protein
MTICSNEKFPSPEARRLIFRHICVAPFGRAASGLAGGAEMPDKGA